MVQGTDKCWDNVFGFLILHTFRLQRLMDVENRWGCCWRSTPSGPQLRHLKSQWIFPGKQKERQVVLRRGSKQIKCTLSAFLSLYASHRSRKSSNPWNSFQLSVVTWGSLTWFSHECQEIVSVTLPATNMGATLWAQIEMWPNQRAAGEASWIKKEAYWVWWRSMLTGDKKEIGNLLKLAWTESCPVGKAGVNVAVSSEMR